MYAATTYIRVRYGETDQMGYLYYGHYALYYESGRTEAIRELGYTYRQMEEDGIQMPVIAFQTEYLRPARYDDLITVKTFVREMPNGSQICFYTELYNEKQKLLNKGATTMVFYDPVSRRKVPVPEVLKEKLLPYFDLSAESAFKR